MATFEPTISQLERAKIRYVIVGGLAVVLQGHPRLTMDLDIVVDLEPDNARQAMEALNAAGFRPVAPVDATAFSDPEARRQWIEEKNMIVFSLRDPDEPTRSVDVFVREPIDFVELWSESEVVALPTTAARIASIPHLIRMKQESGRPIDLDDIEALRIIHETRSKDEGSS